ncbi:MAG TPA: aldehyde reductase [Agromyces sp.]|nr:aldehyde reductase [Agromyces sp.]
MSGELVLITGGTGFIGAHCVVGLLDAGYRVRTTLRDAARTGDLHALVRAGGADPSGIEVAVADLLHDDGWAAAVDGADFVLHVASPFPMREPKRPDDVIAPARDGTLRVLEAAHRAGVRRVVLTSSFAAIGYSTRPDRPYTEADWTDPDSPGLSTYVRSKAVAERTAWEFVRGEGRGLELATVNPGGVFGPALGPDLSTSVALLRVLLNGAVPAVPRGETSGVDVRDVADLHLRAMTHPDAAGERFLAVSGDPISYPDLARLLRGRLGERAARVPRRTLPNWIARIGALVNSDLRAVVPELDRSRRASSEKAQRVLGWRPRPRDEAIVASAESLIRLGLVRS